MKFKCSKILFLTVFSMYVAGCSLQQDVKPVDNRTQAKKYKDKSGSFFDLNNMLTGKKKSYGANTSINTGVNAYLWRGALDTLSVQPLSKVDPRAGIIETSWVSVGGKPDQQVRISALVMSSTLHTSALRVNVYKRVKKEGGWTDMIVGQDVQNKVNDAILQRARELRMLDTRNQ